MLSPDVIAVKVLVFIKQHVHLPNRFVHTTTMCGSGTTESEMEKGPTAMTNVPSSPNFSNLRWGNMPFGKALIQKAFYFDIY